MTKIEFLHLDSFNIPYSTNQTYSTFIFNSTDKNTCPNAFNVEFKLANAKRRVKNIYLRSIELPVSFPNVRSNSNMNFINVIGDGTTYKITLDDKIYKSINELIDDINIISGILYPTQNIICSLSDSTNYGYVKFSSDQLTIVTVGKTNLGYMLGFRDNIDFTDTNLTIASASYQLNIDNYISMYISNINSKNTNNNTLCTFKIPLNATSDVVYYTAENSSFAQFTEITNTNLTIDRLNIIFYDRFGYSLHSNHDWSCTLGFEYY